jgi:hypothetical protein
MNFSGTVSQPVNRITACKYRVQQTVPTYVFETTTDSIFTFTAAHEARSKKRLGNSSGRSKL